MTDFHKTGAGQLFYGKHVPELVKELRRIADGLERGNKLFENEMKLKKRKEHSIKEKIEDIKETEKLNDISGVNQNTRGKDPDLSAIDE